MKFYLGHNSRNNLQGVHPDLIAVVKRAIEITEVDFKVIEGLRNLSRQQKLVQSGASKTMNSRHLTGHAVDLMALVDGKGRWDWPLYHTIAKAMKQASKELGIPLEWGGDWIGWKDGPHYQLPWKQYPKNTQVSFLNKGEKNDERSSTRIRETHTDIRWWVSIKRWFSNWCRS